MKYLVIGILLGFLCAGCGDGGPCNPETVDWNGDWEISVNELANSCECFLAAGRPLIIPVSLLQSGSDITVCSGIRCLFWLFFGTTTETGFIVSGQPYPIQRDCNTNLVDGVLTLEFTANASSTPGVSMNIRANHAISGEECSSEFVGSVRRE